MYYLLLSTQRVVMFLPEKCEFLWTFFEFHPFPLQYSVLCVQRYWMNGGGDTQM